MRMDAANRSLTGGNQPHVVIPHSYADHEFAHKLAGAMRHDRVTPWIDDVDMSAGAFLVPRIFQSARLVDCVVPAISAASVGSNWVQHDLRTVMARGYDGRRGRLLPARVDDCTLPDFLASQPYFDFHRDGWSAAYDDLLVAIHTHMGSKSATPVPSGFRVPKPTRLT